MLITRKRRLPKYVYYCKECQAHFETKHSLQETCVICKVCGYEGSLDRRPSSIFLAKKIVEIERKTRPGEVVTATIEDSKQDLSDEKDRLAQRVYKK